MHLDPTSAEGLAYIADHLGATYDADDFAIFVEDELIKCDDCGRLFTAFNDFDSDLRHDHGVWCCEECAADPDAAPYDLAREERTYSARAL